MNRKSEITKDKEIDEMFKDIVHTHTSFYTYISL